MDTGQNEGWPQSMMAEVLDITPHALSRWQERQLQRPSGCVRGRPCVINDEVRALIRKCYTEHYCQWGPRVLAAWCKIEELGDFSHGAIAAVIADLREEKETAEPPVRYEITASNVMWSEDGTGFMQRRKKQELLVVQDEHSRLKLNWELANGPAAGCDVYRYLKCAFEKHGAPLVLKHDNDAIFSTPEVQELMAKHEVLDLASPVDYPGYNGKQERSMRDIKSYEQAMRKHGVKGSLLDRINITMADLNEHRPRPVLKGRTAQVAYNEGKTVRPDRKAFRATVAQNEKKLLLEAKSRYEERNAHRWAIEQALMCYGLMEIEGNVSHSFLLEVGT